MIVLVRIVLKHEFYLKGEKMDMLRQWLLDLLYENNVMADESIEELVDDIENIIEDAGYVKQ